MFLEHVNLTVTDLDRSVAFYRDLLDLRIRWEGTTSDGQRACHIGDDRSYLALFEARHAVHIDADYDRVGINHFAFVVDDLAACKQRVESLDARVHAEFDYEPGKRVYVFDPDGIEIELVQYD